MYFFEAYGIQKGISYSGHSHLFRSVSFGILTFAYITILEAWLRPKFQITGLWRKILWYLFLVIVGIQLIYLLFNFFWNWQEWNLEAYSLICQEFPLMMIIPIAIYSLVKKIPIEVNKEVNFVTFKSENGKDQLRIRLENFLFATSSNNYISINHISNKTSKQHVIRKPLKVLEEELGAFEEVMRVHRSYLVNKTNIQNIRQEKTKLYIELLGASVPVSKKFQQAILSLK